MSASPSRPARFIALLGLNGAGKSTLFSLVTRLFAIQAGTHPHLRPRRRREPGEALRLLGVVFQPRTLDLDLSVMQNLLYHAALHGIGAREARTRAGEVLTRIGLADRAERQGARSLGRADAAASRSRARCCTGRGCCCSTSRPSASTSRRAPTSSAMSAGWSPNEGVGVLWATHLVDEIADGDDLDRAASRPGARARPGRARRRDAGARRYARRVHALTGRRARMRECAHERAIAKASTDGGFRSAQYLICLNGIVWREGLRFLHQRERFISALVRPLVWLFIFAAGFRQVLGVSIIPPYETYILYEVYITPGLMAMIQLFNGMQSSLSMVYDREMGNMRTLLVSPLPRWYPAVLQAARRHRGLAAAGLCLSRRSRGSGRSSRRRSAISRCCRRWSCPA